MRISANKNDAAFHSGYESVQVLLDGIVQKNAIVADDEKGEVVRYAIDVNGGIVPDGAGGVTVETVQGTVEIVFV